MRALLVLTLLTFSALAQSGSTRLSVTVTDECARTGLSHTITWASEGTPASEGERPVITGTTRFRYLLRASPQTGGAEIRFQFGPEFSGAGAVFSYNTSVTAGVGSALSGRDQQAGQPAVAARFGGNAHTARSGDSGVIDWSWRGPAGSARQAPSAPILSITWR